jgi:hypothetical protein
MIMHVAFHTSDGWKITEAIVQAALLTYICSEQFIPCDPWDEDSVMIQEKSNRDEMRKIGDGISIFIAEQIERLEQDISYSDLRDKMMEELNVPKKQLRYKTRELIVSVAECAKASELKFWHCYLTTRSDDEADLRVTVCHGIDGTVVDKTDEFLDEIYPIDTSRLDDGDIETFDEISNSDISKSEKHLFVGGATLKVSNKKNLAARVN